MKAYLSKKTKLNAVFFKTTLGNEPVRDWLKDLSKEEKKIIGTDIQTIQFGLAIGHAISRQFGKWIVGSSIKIS